MSDTYPFGQSRMLPGFLRSDLGGGILANSRVKESAYGSIYKP